MSAKEKEKALFDKLEALGETEIKVWLDSIKKLGPDLVKNPITKKK
jgi:hypothetical protein